MLKFYKIFLFCQIIPFILNEIKNCLNENNNICENCELGYYLLSNTCKKCEDLNCNICSAGKKACHSCEKNYILKSKQCGIKCNDNNIKGCELCLSDYSECLKCKKNCKWNGKKCSCTERNLLIIFLTLMSLIIIIIFILCLAKPNYIRKFYLFKFALDANEGIMIQKGIIPGTKDIKDENRVNKLSIEDEKINQNKFNNDIYNDNKNDLIEDTLTKNQEEKDLCDYCLIEKASIKLNCGCNLCENHKNLGKGKCPVCGKLLN